MNNDLPTLDVIIPCYQAAETLERAVNSCLQQSGVTNIILVDDGSTDNTWELIQILQSQYSQVIGLKMPENSGVAMARNWGTLHSQADLVAFLDADDAYEEQALAPIASVFYYLPELSLLRLKFTPVNLSDEYLQHPKFDYAWEIVQMTGAGNTVFRRNILLAAGGFPQDELFKRLGGEDGALGIALVKSTAVGTLFEEKYQGVKLYCRPGMHAEGLLRAALFNEHHENITHNDMAYANRVTEKIIKRLKQCQSILQVNDAGRRPISIDYESE